MLLRMQDLLLLLRMLMLHAAVSVLGAAAATNALLAGVVTPAQLMGREASLGLDNVGHLGFLPPLLLQLKTVLLLLFLKCQHVHSSVCTQLASQM
jgi:hypothetical protein